MHSVRRAALRAASSSVSVLATGVSRQQTASLAMQLSRSAARPAVSMFARPFSHTSRAAQDDSANKLDTLNEIEAQPAAVDAASPRPSTAKVYNLFIRNITFDATDMHMREAFGKYGEVLEARIARDGRGLSRGFGFVAFSDKASADRAIAEADKSFWHGRRISVEHSVKDHGTIKPSRQPITQPTDSLYIGNIPYETSDADLNRLFHDLDGVKDVRVAVDRNTGWPRGFAHADFNSVEDCTKAHEKLMAMEFGGRKLRIDYSNRK